MHIFSNNYKKILLVSAIFGVIGISLSDYLFAVMGFHIENITASDKLLGSIYFLTLIVIFWYTKETAILRKVSAASLEVASVALEEQQKNSVLAMKPLVVVIGTESHCVRIRNIGNGAALNVEIQGHPYDESIRVRFEQITGITTDVDWVEDVSPRSTDNLELYKKIWNSSFLCFCIKFEDMLGREYYSYCEATGSSARSFRFQQRALHRCQFA